MVSHEQRWHSPSHKNPPLLKHTLHSTLTLSKEEEKPKSFWRGSGQKNFCYHHLLMPLQLFAAGKHQVLKREGSSTASVSKVEAARQTSHKITGDSVRVLKLCAAAKCLLQPAGQGLVVAVALNHLDPVSFECHR